MTGKGVVLFKKVQSVLFIFFLNSGIAFSSGMYIPLPEKLPVKQLKKIGLKVSPQEIHKIATQAVARISPGCSSTFMSSNGILGTNWHCARACAAKIQAKAQKEEGIKHPYANLTATGYIAKNRSEELKCEGGHAKVPLGIKNISARFKDIEENKNLKPKELAEKRRKRKERIREECRGGKKNIVCDVVFMNSEKNPYFLFKYKKFEDVRLVWIPPDIIGGFGGLTDNWEYPRYCGDFAFLRVYENGKPYKPKKFVEASSKGLRPGDPQFIVGFPGSTERNISSHAAKFMQKLALPYQHHVYGALLEGIEALGPNPKQGPYGSKWFYLENYYENFKRKSNLMKSLKVIRKKQALEIRKGISGRALKKIERIFDQRYGYYPTQYLLHRMLGEGSPARSLTVAAYLWQWSTQPSEDRERKKDVFKSWNRNHIETLIKTADDQITLKGEKALLAVYFKLADALPVRIRSIDDLKTKTIRYFSTCHADAKVGSLSNLSLCHKTVYEQMAEVLFQGTEILARNSKTRERRRAREVRMKMFSMWPKELVDTQDSLILFAKRLVEESGALDSDWEYGAPRRFVLGDLRHEQNLLIGHKTPDANSTVRFTESTVQVDYKPIYKKGTFGYETGLSGMVARDRFLPKDHEEYSEFLVPDALKQAKEKLSSFGKRYFYDQNLKDVPINFITQHLITGGNSGSGVFNAEGELVGFAFDGTPESILSDVALHPQSRTIAVDVRYAGFLGEEIYPTANWILKEIGLPVAQTKAQKK